MVSEIISGSDKTLKVAKNGPTETNIQMLFRVIPSFKLLYLKGFYSANFLEVTQKLALC